MRVEQGCVADGHLDLDEHYDDVSVEACAGLCDDAGDLCVGFECVSCRVVLCRVVPCRVSSRHAISPHVRPLPIP